MAIFNIKFKFVNGDTKTFTQYRRDSYNVVASEVLNSSDGWFGATGDLVNLSNVLTCKIIEVDENGYQINIQ